MLLGRKTQKRVPQFGGSWWCTSVWYKPAHLTWLDSNGEFSHCEGPHSSPCDQSFGGGEEKQVGNGGSSCAEPWWRWCLVESGTKELVGLNMFLWWFSPGKMGTLRKGRPCLLPGEVSAPGQASESSCSYFRLPSWCPFPLPWNLWSGAPYPMNGFSSQVFLPSFVERVLHYSTVSRAGVSLWWDRAACFALAWGLHLAWTWQ